MSATASLMAGFGIDSISLAAPTAMRSQHYRCHHWCRRRHRLSDQASARRCHLDSIAKPCIGDALVRIANIGDGIPAARPSKSEILNRSELYYY
jgi:hypothetical protein